MSDREGAAELRASAAIPTALGLIAIFVVSRLILVTVAAFVEGSTPLIAGASATSTPIIRSLTHGDSPWYVGIAANGYHLEPLRAAFHDFVFFPFYPLLIRIAGSFTGGDLALAGVLVSNAAFGLALIAFERLSRPILGVRLTLIAAAFLAFAPGAVAFGMAYTESVFLLLSIGAVLAAQRRAYVVMGVLFALAALTRLPGVVLIVPLALTMAGVARPGRVGGARSANAPRRRDWLWLAAGPIALAGYLGALWRLTGDPLAWLKAQDAWNHPPDTLGPAGMPAIPTIAIVLGLIAVIAFHLFQLIYLRTSRIPLAHVAYALVALVALAVTARIVSMPRYLAVLWPFPWVLTSRRSSVFITVALALFVVSFAGFAYLDFTVLAA